MTGYPLHGIRRLGRPEVCSRLIDLAERGNAWRVKASGEDDVCLITNLPRYRCDHCLAGSQSPAKTGTRAT
jgi:hypothetical protein